MTGRHCRWNKALRTSPCRFAPSLWSIDFTVQLLQNPRMGLPRDVFDALSVESRNFYFCRVAEKEAVEFDTNDKSVLLKQFDGLLREIDKRWVGGSYYSGLHFAGFPMVKKYLKSVEFASCGRGAGLRTVRIEMAIPSSSSHAPKTQQDDSAGSRAASGKDS